jgi:Rieske Fe-S protein
MLISDLILGRPNRWERLYAVGRITPKAAADFAKENLNVAARLATDYLSGGDAPSSDALKPGEGAIVRRGLRKLAVWRDPAGTLHERSAICPHMGCIVAWNALETCWDCPCHGSQFAPDDGRVLNGPAASGLAKLR